MTLKELFLKLDKNKNEFEEIISELDKRKSIFDYLMLQNYMSSNLKKDIDNYNTRAGYENAFRYLLEVSKIENLIISEDIIKKFHELIYIDLCKEEAGVYAESDVKDIPHLMEHFIKQMEYSKNLLHPVEYAAMCCKRINDIYPFKEGNDQIGILIMNLILINNKYGGIIIPFEVNDKYKCSLKRAKLNPIDIDEFLCFIAESTINTQEKLLNLV